MYLLWLFRLFGSKSRQRGLRESFLLGDGELKDRFLVCGCSGGICSGGGGSCSSSSGAWSLLSTSHVRGVKGGIHIISVGVLICLTVLSLIPCIK